MVVAVAFNNAEAADCWICADVDAGVVDVDDADIGVAVAVVVLIPCAASVCPHSIHVFFFHICAR